MTRRLLLSYLSVTLFVLIILEVPFGAFFATRERERLLTSFERSAVVFGSIYEDALDAAAPYDPSIAQDWAKETGARVVVVNADGVAIVDTEGSLYEDFSNREEIQQALAGRRASGRRASVTLGSDLMYVAVPVASGGQVHGAVRITFSPTEVEARIHRFWFGLAGVAAVALAAMALIGWVIARSIRRPLVDVRDAALRAASGDLGVEIDPGDAPGEVRDLALGFNHMVSRIRGLLERERRFVSDASHQLRTPLTALRLRLENLESDLADSEQRGDTVAALREVDRLGDLVNQLLVLARAERGGQPVERVDLAGVAEERRLLWEALAEEQGVALVPVGLDRPAPVLAVPGAMEQVIDNLLENALTVAPDGSEVIVEVTADRSTLRVVDQGPGMSAEQRRQAFERFWRGRSGGPGTGLGLAIVRELVEASGGSTRLDAVEAGGLAAVVVLPPAPRDVEPDRPRTGRPGSTLQL